MKAIGATIALLTVAAVGVPEITTTPEAVCKPGQTLVWLPGKPTDAPPGNTEAEAIRFEFKRAMLVAEVWQLPWCNGNAMPFFGARLTACAAYDDTIRVLYYRHRSRACALRLMGVKEDESIVLYLPEESQSMTEALAWVKTWSQRPAEAVWGRDRDLLGPLDDVRIPKVALRVPSAFSFLMDGTGRPFEPRPIPQIIHGFTPFRPSRYWFDRPFFLFLWKKKSDQPHAGIWFGDTSGFMKE